MNLLSLRIRNFRNYTDAYCLFAPGTNVITGENAQGKTNLLEAVYLLTGAHSFRTRFDRELIAFDQNTAELIAEVSAAGRIQQISLTLHRGAGRRLLINQARKTGAELRDTVKAVLFCPDDLNIIRNGPAARRRLLDEAISQLRPGYGKYLSDYQKLYANKTRLLRDYRDNPRTPETCAAFSQAMAALSAKIIRYRAAFARRLAKAAAPIHRSFSGTDETLETVYTTVSTVTDPTASEKEIYEEVLAHQEQRLPAEIASGNCLTGIHKDDLRISVNGQYARTYASQGQTRTAALSLKLAQREIFLTETGEYPILLLDDVLSELDAKRQAFVLNRIGGGQTLITCCEDKQIVEKTGGQVIFVENGRIRQNVSTLGE